jgi:acetoin utilization protein AcuC
MKIIHSPRYAGWVFDPTHPTQGRRFVNGCAQIQTLHPEVDVIDPGAAPRELLEAVHEADYVAEVLDMGVCDEWAGERKDMSALAQLFVAGTLTAIDESVWDQDGIAIHLPGAKHHAQVDRSSGFCVFNDWAIAAEKYGKLGKRIFIIDIDAHHGDGVENLTRDMPHVMCASVHDSMIFPGTGKESDLENNVLNYPMPMGAGDKKLVNAVKDALAFGSAFEPDMVWITCGADGHSTDPLSTLDYSVNGFRNVAHAIARHFPGVPITVGGAGGYQPDDWTPRVWAEFVDALVTTRRRMKLPKIDDAS